MSLWRRDVAREGVGRGGTKMERKEEHIRQVQDPMRHARDASRVGIGTSVAPLTVQAQLRRLRIWPTFSFSSIRKVKTGKTADSDMGSIFQIILLASFVRF